MSPSFKVRLLGLDRGAGRLSSMDRVSGVRAGELETGSLALFVETLESDVALAAHRLAVSYFWLIGLAIWGSAVLVPTEVAARALVAVMPSVWAGYLVLAIAMVWVVWPGWFLVFAPRDLALQRSIRRRLVTLRLAVERADVSTRIDIARVVTDPEHPYMTSILSKRNPLSIAVREADVV